MVGLEFGVDLCVIVWKTKNALVFGMCCLLNGRRGEAIFWRRGANDVSEHLG